MQCPVPASSNSNSLPPFLPTAVTTMLWLYNTQYHDSISSNLPLPFFISNGWQFAFNASGMMIHDVIYSMLCDCTNCTKSTYDVHIRFTDNIIPLALHPYKLGKAEIFKVIQSAPVLSALVGMYVFSVLTDNNKTSNPRIIREVICSTRPVVIHFMSHDRLCKLVEQYKKKESDTLNAKLNSLTG